MTRPRGPGEIPDTELITSIGRGDAEAYTEMLDRHSRAVFRYAWGLADQRSDVDDIVQETFLVAWRRRKDIRIVGSSALPWLLTSARNIAMNTNRQRRSHRIDEIDEHTGASDAWYRQVEHDEAAQQLRWVQNEIAALDSPDRELCELCLLQDRTYDEAAAMLGLSPVNARKRIQRSRARLRTNRAAQGMENIS
ncbi:MULTISPECIES: sigma-70 family RNA polymerase sigma factor [Curtobacterium]|uniref:RNA polymerase sigma-70 factor (ECF subfamily) n=1 Tax=Curtobacterium salicis TaxID=1779862 RepID=A0ABX0T2T1_9MICO|nr:sigma-70 family RNA polymerase sigma factor [Curtobacterium sp. CFBP9011]MDY1004356.1 sigma-70 family RNA polymerase sigma factor [Curtobacterium sp. CFBP9011]NII39791.1 RNA polymerase sigma-70 factor (ECF subfamily) [Curtobacterium sp. WW7]